VGDEIGPLLAQDDLLIGAHAPQVAVEDGVETERGEGRDRGRQRYDPGR
jgi:hypothetical protein